MKSQPLLGSQDPGFQRSGISKLIQGSHITLMSEIKGQKFPNSGLLGSWNKGQSQSPEWRGSFPHHPRHIHRYMMSNGYKPAPLDLSHVRLTPAQTTLVDRLAENGHNVWARDRVAQGWSYSAVQDIPARRNPRLVPYRLLDEATKRSNRDSLCQAVRTLLGYGYNIEPPDQEPSEC